MRCESVIDAARHSINRIQDVGFPKFEREQRELLALREFVSRGNVAPAFAAEAPLLKTLMRLIDDKGASDKYSVAEMRRSLIDVERRILSVVEDGGALQTLKVIYHIRTLLSQRGEHIISVADRNDGCFTREDVELLKEHCTNYQTVQNERSLDFGHLQMVWSGVENEYRGDVKRLATYAVEFYRAMDSHVRVE